MIVFEMSVATKGLSASLVAKSYWISVNIKWLCMHEVRFKMKSFEVHLMTDNVQFGEFVFVWKENINPTGVKILSMRKVVCAIELGENERIKPV